MTPQPLSRLVASRTYVPSRSRRLGRALLAVWLCAAAGACSKAESSEDRADGRAPEAFAEVAADVFKEMDGGIALTPEEIKGRNTWNLWCGGNEQFWDRMARESFGLMDLLKSIDSRKRGERFKELGLINQPGFRKATKPDQYGLWIDEAVEPEPADIDPKVHGRPTGIMGFRLFDNPDFTAEAAKKWDGKLYDTDPDYGVRSDLVRPYRVGVACGSCHIAFHPCRPPADRENPRWENLASAIGNQYVREGAIFARNVQKGGLFWEMLKLQPPGTSDTSRIATDHINNPNMINPIFALGARLAMGSEEDLGGETMLLPSVTEKRMRVPHVLKDGADSVGMVGATLRVYVNIGMHSQHWLQQHNPLIGFGDQKPFSIKTAQANSVYWLATQQKFGNVARFFHRLEPYRLEDAPGGRDHMTQDAAVLTRGKLVFADHCASCHSSKRPPAGTEGAAAKEWFRNEVVKPDFRDGNFFSDDQRKRVTDIGTNAARACGTNATKGHVWAAFSSESYKNLPTVGAIDVWNPYTDQTEKFPIPAGGPGYYRTPSLISIWSSAPFLHNNALGKYTGDPSVKGRLEAFDDAAEKLLWPEKRLGKDSIWRTSEECQLQVQLAAIPKALRILLAPHADPDGYFRLGPIPAGTPVNLLANLDPKAGIKDLATICIKIKKVLLKARLEKLDRAAVTALMRSEVAPALWNASKCPDLVVDRGHEFGSKLPDDDKRALIEFLKTL